MNRTCEAWIDRLHASGWQLALALTGGGATALAALQSRPGASRTLLEGIVPYSHEALTEWLGRAPEQACSETAARAMAMAAWRRAARLAGQEAAPERLAGVAATCSLASDRPKRGDHRVHVAAHTTAATCTASLVLSKGARSRGEEEQVAASLILATAARALGVEPTLPRTTLEMQLRADEHVVERAAQARPQWRRLYEPSGGLVVLSNAGQPLETAPPVALALPGSFNPLHRGHLAMMDYAEARYGVAGHWEISVQNVDKPPLDYLTLGERIAGIVAVDGRRGICLTAAPTFAEKARWLPGVTFVVGLDTVQRLVDPKYYGGSLQTRDEALAALTAAGCRFLALGRLVGEKFQTLGDLELPAALRGACEGAPAEAFRVDVSSTELRAADQASE
jgi:nicotinamide mononucleotide (NMN) deamidase PncC